MDKLMYKKLMDMNLMFNHAAEGPDTKVEVTVGMLDTLLKGILAVNDDIERLKLRLEDAVRFR